MCGIIGIRYTNGTTVDVTTLRAATDLMHRRGPDDVGTWVDEGIGLGHRRLAVLDLTAAGHQPMHHLGRYVIVFNGEIYNHVEIRKELDKAGPTEWQSASDTEVILAAYHRWGPSCLSRFHGMFAFGIWDRVEKKLFLARDRLGVKPLYYASLRGTLTFASRPRALLRLAPDLSRALDVSALRTYLEAGYIPAPASIYESIRKLPPGHYLMLSAEGELTVKQYWDFRHIAPEPSWNQRREGDLLDELDEILTRSVRLRMVSDAPVGAFLSGGIDSSLIVAKMASFSSRPPTSLTIGFRESDFDESSAAERVARHLGTEHYSAIMQVDDLLELMPHFLSEFDEPCFDYSYFPTMAVSRLARQHVTVSLSGDGGDELFGGYHYYQIARSLAPVFALPSAVRRGLSNLVRQVPSNGFQLLSAAMRQSNSVAAFAFTRSIAKDFQLPIAPELLHSTRALSELFEETASTFPLGICSAEQAMRLDLSYTLPDDYLHKLDRSSMAFSLESREPLLDQDLVEWCMKLPIHWKLRGLTNKYLLRKLLYRYVPRKLVDRPKMGFGVPMAQWLRGPLKTFAMERFTTSRLFERVPIDQKKVLELYDLHLSGKRNVAPLIWALLALLDQLSRD